MPDYVPTDWVDNTTPVDESRMDHLEAGVDAALPRDGEATALVRILASKLLLADANVAFRVLGDGKVEWGAGGASALDANLYRAAVSRLASDDGFDPASLNIQIKAGAPVDGDIVGGAQNGDIVLDTTNSRLYVRIAGAWHYMVVDDGAAGGGSTIEYENAWSAIVSYTPGDVVIHNGVEYLSVNPSLNQTPPTPASIPPLTISLVTALPSSPFDGQEVIFTDSLTSPTYTWRLRYVAAKATNKWVFVGGSPLYAEVVTEEARAPNTYGDMATVGPSIAIPVAGRYEVAHGFAFTTANTMFMSYTIGATAAVDADAVWGNTRPNASRVRQKDFTAVTLTAKYRTDTGASQSGKDRWMRVIPIAVGG